MALLSFRIQSKPQLYQIEGSAFFLHNIITRTTFQQFSAVFCKLEDQKTTMWLLTGQGTKIVAYFLQFLLTEEEQIQDQFQYCVYFFEERMKTVDKYQFNEELGIEDDGIATFTAHHTILKRDFTLKMVSQGSTAEKDKYNYLIKQAQVLKKLIHPNIYKCHKLLRSTNNFYVIYDNIRTKTLDQVLSGNVSFQSKLIIIKQLIETLLFIKHCKFTYLGLRPSNILVQENFKIVLKNFGHAEQFEDGAEVIDLVTFQGKVDTFTPPELKKGKVYPNSDFYSLGMMIGMMFQKEFQFGSKDPKEEYRIVSDQYNINMTIDLILLKELANKLTNPNQFERSDFLELIKTRKGSISNDTEKRAGFLSATKPSTQHDIKSMKSIDLTQIPQLQRSKSFKNILSGEKKQLDVQTLEELALFVIKERNFSLLLVNMSSVCLKNRQASINTLLVLSFLLMKKATTVISQLAKLLKQGSNNEITIGKKMMDYFKKTPAYEQFLVLTNQQMGHTHKAFQQLISQIKNLPELRTNQLLQAQLKFEKISSVFIKRSVLQFLLQLSLLSTQNYLNQYSSTSLYYLYLLSLLSDYQSYEQMYQQLFSEGIDGFENEPFIQELSKVDRKKVVQLIEYNTNVIFSEENYRSPLAVKNALTIK